VLSRSSVPLLLRSGCCSSHLSISLEETATRSSLVMEVEMRVRYLEVQVSMKVDTCTFIVRSKPSVTRSSQSLNRRQIRG
jgi:hypothetical protein